MFLKKRVSALLIIAVLINLLPFNPVHAQSGNKILLSVAIPNTMTDTFVKVINDFEAQHLNVSIQVVANSPTIPSAAQGLNAQLDAVSQYVSSADVLYVDSNRISEEATRAGYFLDLAPFANTCYRAASCRKH